ncbi:MAG: CBS domain-containing protein [Candidatus Dormibacteria bacterium]
MLVRELMSTDLVTVEPATTVGAAAALMGQRHVGSLLVVEDGRPAAIFTERDIVRALTNSFDAPSNPVSAWMTAEPRTISPDLPAEDALGIMVRGHFRHLPVTEGGLLVGMLSMRDISRARHA